MLKIYKHYALRIEKGAKMQMIFESLARTKRCTHCATIFNVENKDVERQYIGRACLKFESFSIQTPLLEKLFYDRYFTE